MPRTSSTSLGMYSIAYMQSCLDFPGGELMSLMLKLSRFSANISMSHGWRAVLGRYSILWKVILYLQPGPSCQSCPGSQGRGNTFGWNLSLALTGRISYIFINLEISQLNRCTWLQKHYWPYCMSIHYNTLNGLAFCNQLSQSSNDIYFCRLLIPTIWSRWRIVVHGCV